MQLSENCYEVFFTNVKIKLISLHFKLYFSIIDFSHDDKYLSHNYNSCIHHLYCLTEITVNTWNFFQSIQVIVLKGPRHPVYYSLYDWVTVRHNYVNLICGKQKHEFHLYHLANWIV
jgi:hypothetical protein